MRLEKMYKTNLHLTYKMVFVLNLRFYCVAILSELWLSKIKKNIAKRVIINDLQI